MDKLSQAAEYADMFLIAFLAIGFVGSLGAYEVGNIGLRQMVFQMLICAGAISAVYNLGLFRRIEYICRKTTKK